MTRKINKVWDRNRLNYILYSGNYDFSKIRVNLHNVLQEILSHTDFVNSVTYNGDSGSLVASAGDDLTARVWDSSSQTQISKFLLTSPGMLSVVLMIVISIHCSFYLLRRMITHVTKNHRCI